MPIDQTSPIEVTAFAWVPPFARGFVRVLALATPDMPVSVPR